MSTKIYYLDWNKTNDETHWQIRIINSNELFEEKLNIIQKAINDGLYEYVGEIPGMNLEGVFSIMQGDFRPNLLNEKFGRRRSMSVTDIVIHEGTPFLCCSFGWTQLDGLTFPKVKKRISVTREEIEQYIRDSMEADELRLEKLAEEDEQQHYTDKSIRQEISDAEHEAQMLSDPGIEDGDEKALMEDIEWRMIRSKDSPHAEIDEGFTDHSEEDQQHQEELARERDAEKYTLNDEDLLLDFIDGEY